MSPDVFLKDAQDIYADTVREILAEIDPHCQHLTNKDMHLLARDAFGDFKLTYADFIQWVNYGDDQKAKTLDVIRAGIRVTNMNSLWR